MDYDAYRLQLLVFFLNMIIDKSEKSVEFYEAVLPSTGSSLLSALNTQVFKSSTEQSLLHDFVHLIGKLFSFSPSWLQRKLNFNLKQLITLVSFALVRDQFDEIFFLDLMIMIKDITKYIETRNLSPIMPIKSKKLYDDIHDISTRLALTLEPIIRNEAFMDHHTYIHIFDSLTCSILILPFAFRDCQLYIPCWIKLLNACDLEEDDELVNTILCCLHATSKKNQLTLEPFVETMHLTQLLKGTYNSSMKHESLLTNKLGNHALIGFVHIWFRKTSMDKVYPIFIKHKGHKHLCNYLIKMEQEAEQGGYDEKFLKSFALITHCFVMLMAFRKTTLVSCIHFNHSLLDDSKKDLYDAGVLPVLFRLSKLYQGESHRLVMTAILNICKYGI